ncbi:DUF3524 domain-containing protein [Bacteriovoracaceae bacterium]|nr:DUF3524 domain-containing protein [Bacteriovoracaceae bacterium]
MKIALIEPFFTGSHKSWAESLQKYSQHEVKIFSLPGRHWKWRMNGGAVTLAHEFLRSDFLPDLILATDMLDFATFLGLVGKKYSQVPTAIYFHENQLTYPWSEHDRDKKKQTHLLYGFINYTSCLVADNVFFNSHYHHSCFMEALPKMLKGFPDYQNLDSIKAIKNKSVVLPLGLNLPDQVQPKLNQSKIPTLLWNHRWEYDKNPAEFFNVLYRLKEEKIQFKLILLGESYSSIPGIFKEAQIKLKNEIIHMGYADRETYENLLQKCDILPVTSIHDFFGASVVEAIAHGVYPLLPNRLAYPEHLPSTLRENHLYNSSDQLYKKLKRLCESVPSRKSELIENVKKYDWKNIISLYDKAFSKI